MGKNAISIKVLNAATAVKNKVDAHYEKITEKEYGDLAVQFIYNCPAKAGPDFSKKFEDYGLKPGNDYKKLKQMIKNNLNIAENNKEDYIACSIEQEIENNIQKIYDSIDNSKAPFICFYEDDGFHLDSFFTKFRNAIAHGQVAKKDGNIIFWDKDKNRGLRSVIILNSKHIKKIFEALEGFGDSSTKKAIN